MKGKWLFDEGEKCWLYIIWVVMSFLLLLLVSTDE